MSSNSTSTPEWELLGGQVVSKNFSAGYVVLSYLVSYVGAWTTLELINRRTAMRGFYNWFLLVGSSVSMGGIAIWCMHFIGNRAVTLGNGEASIQIAYNSGFTAISFFLPIIVLFLAFWAVGSNERVSFARVALGGTLAGLGICGMHYLGQAGISNYDCIYQVKNIVGAAIIAVVASVAALGIFFIWRSSWDTSWWKRAICAIALAGAVSGMHWLASVGTQYRLRVSSTAPSSNFSRNSTVIVVIVLSVAGCIILLSFTLVAQRRRSRSANRAQQVVLAAAVFDAEGRLLVSPEGLLPNRKITNSFVERSFDDIFGISHPVFMWIFRTTRNWESVTNLLPGMRTHIRQVALRGTRAGSKGEVNLTNDQGAPIEDYSIIFRELFCVAASDLAEDLNQPLDKSGILFDQIISTGQERKQKGRAKPGRSPDSSVDLERGGLAQPLFGRGQLLFLVNSVGRREMEHLQAAGYRFATISNVAPILARSMQVNGEDLSRRLETMRSYASETHILDPGVHLACFAVRATVSGGFDVLVRKDARNQLPTMQLPLDRLEAWQIEYLRSMDSYSVAACVKHLSKVFKSTSISPKEEVFISQFLTTLEALNEEINDSFFNDALLIANPIRAPCRGPTEDSAPGMAALITFRLVAPIHSRAPGTKLEFTPVEFFKMQQHLYKNSPSHSVFARKTYREFAPVVDVDRRLSVTELKSPLSAYLPGKSKIFGKAQSLPTVKSIELADASGKHPMTRNGSKGRFWGRGGFKPERPMESDNSSEKNLVDLNVADTHTVSGIMVSQEVTVDVRDASNSSLASSSSSPKRSPEIEMENLDESAKSGIFTKATKEDGEPETFVDVLFGLVFENRA